MYRTHTKRGFAPYHFCRKSDKGFALIEVLVSIFILGIMSVASATLLNGGSARRVTLDGSTALMIAKNEIETIRAGGYAAVPVSGPFANPALANLSSGTGTLVTSQYDAGIKQVAVEVTWTEPDSTVHTVSLTTLITENGGL